MNSNVIELHRTRSAAQVNHDDSPEARPNTCPAWCINDGSGHEFHRGAFRAHLEHDDNNEVVMALGGRVEAFPSARPMVSVLLWEAEEGDVVAEGRGLLTPAEVREVAGHLLMLAAEAEGVA